MSLEHAIIEILEPAQNQQDSQEQPERIKIKVSFNPTELTFTKGAQFAEIAIPGLDAPIQQFIRGDTETLSLELFFDATDEGMGKGAPGVMEKTDAIYQLVKQARQTHAPPKCRFQWGQLSFTCVVEQVERRFLLFSPEGVPLRARLTIRLREYQTIDEMVARLESADHTQARVFRRRERLDQLSTEAYNRPSEWRRIAEANDIDDPRRVPPGTLLEIPPMRVESALRRGGL